MAIILTESKEFTMFIFITLVKGPFAIQLNIQKESALSKVASAQNNPFFSVSFPASSDLSLNILKEIDPLQHRTHRTFPCSQAFSKCAKINHQSQFCAQQI